MLTINPQFYLNGHQFKSTDELISFAQSINKETHQFLINWFDTSAFLLITTSGSIGKPKVIKLKKEHMINSAKATGAYFNLPENTTALLCLSTQYIAGKMMLVRAMTLGWKLDLVNPESNPLQHSKKCYDFCAMVPMQVDASLHDLHRIKILIIGGGAVSKSLQQKLQPLKTVVFATYGMTETATHIAIQRLNNHPTDFFECLNHIKIAVDNRNCLIIDAPKITDELLITNDVVEIIDEHRFKWLGRFDHIINSGGIKLLPEQIENKLTAMIPYRFFIASEKDELLGEKVVLVIESLPLEEQNLLELKSKLKLVLSPYEIPKLIYFTPNFIETVTKKIQRAKTLELIMNKDLKD